MVLALRDNHDVTLPLSKRFLGFTSSYRRYVSDQPHRVLKDDMTRSYTCNDEISSLLVILSIVTI